MPKKAPTPPAPALEEIIDHAHLLSRTREQLGTMVAELNKGIEALKADALPEIRTAIEAASSAWEQLAAAVREHPELFTKPRSLEAHGIKFGYRKGTGGLVIEDEERTVQLIEKHLVDQVDVLVSVRKVPVKAALAQLPATDLKKIGVEIEGTDDVVFIKPAEGGVDKLVKALVKAAVEGD